MKSAVDNLMFRGPSWLIYRHVKDHPSNGLDVVFRRLKRCLPAVLVDERGGGSLGSGWAIRDVVYTRIRLASKKRSYITSVFGDDEYLVVEFSSESGGGYLQIGREWQRALKCVLGGWNDYRFVKTDLDRIFDCELPQSLRPSGLFGHDLFGIIDEHNEYPIWATRCAVLTFLLCVRSIFAAEVAELIAKKIWASRRDRKVWWPDVRDDDWNFKIKE